MLVESDRVRLIWFCVCMPQEYATRVLLSSLYLWVDGRASLKKANLGKAHLEGADLTYANLEDADLFTAHLEKADLGKAHLEGADLTYANLEDADLFMAHLEKADLGGANLLAANFAGANVNAVVFEIQPKTLPLIPGLATTQNLAMMTYSTSPHALVELRGAFKEAGMRKQEREITFAIKHTDRVQQEAAAQRKDENGTFIEISDWGMYLEARVNYYLLEWTCDWGMSPGKPLKLLLMLVGGFTLLYMLAVDPHPNAQRSGVWKIFPDKNSLYPEGEDKFKQIVANSFFGMCLWGLYISVLSTFHIGWRDLNVGTWISRLQPQPFTIQTIGWVRVVSGIQSLISVYLLALSVLTYFGRPFE